jgi:UDP-N-acetylmuramate--alanine ligase
MILRSGTLRGSRLYLIGIKGTGMSALAELLLSEGASVSGSDVEERFYTDEILEKNAIPVHQGFDPANVPAEADLVIYSPAYDPATHPELIRTRELGHRMLEYTAALGSTAPASPWPGFRGYTGKPPPPPCSGPSSVSWIFQERSWWAQLSAISAAIRPFPTAMIFS